MEAMGRDGGWGPSLPWSYRRQKALVTGTGSSSYTVSSSRSGTIVSSTGYTSSSSRLSSGISMDAALQLDLELELRLGLGTPDKKDAEFAQPIKKPRKKTEETLKEKRMKRIESLVQEFFRGQSENRSIKGGGGSGDMGVLESWFSEMGVSWVLQLDVCASALVLGHPPVGDTGSWIPALTQIMETIHLTESFFPDHGHGFLGMPGISKEEVKGLFGSHPGPAWRPGSLAWVRSWLRGSIQTGPLDPVQFALFFQEAMSKMLVFVDVMFSKSLSKRGPPYISNSLISCLDIHSALFKALSGIRLQFHSSTPAEVEKIEKEMVSLLSAKQGMACVAIWSALEETRTRVLNSMEDSSGTQSPQGSSDIHEATYSLMDHITFLLHNHSVTLLLVFKAVSIGKYVPQIEVVPPLISLVMEMVSCYEEKLITKSQLFLDKGLGLLFLLNNSNFTREQLQDTLSSITLNVQLGTRKDELGHYIESYIQVSWAPMLSCLSNHTPLCLGRNYSPLSKFESEFQKTYTIQKLWRVPDPELRKRLRKAVIGKIIPGYTKYIEDNEVSDPKFTPHELEEMLQELFEG